MTVTRSPCLCILLVVNVWIGESDVQTRLEKKCLCLFRRLLPYGKRGNDTVEYYSQNSQHKKSVTSISLSLAILVSSLLVT